MTNDEEKTPWFTGAEQPAREGVYETQFGGYAYFDMKGWGLTSLTPDDAVVSYSMFGAEPTIPPTKWRGLAECPQPDLFASL